MSKRHKWYREICAWADGAEIQLKEKDGTWVDIEGNQPSWINYIEYRIKPQPKEPQYLYVWKNNIHEIKLTTSEPHPLKEYASNNWKCVGKIKLEVDE